ncbi:MAG: thiamine phosphate synthase [Nitrospira sp.]|nr:thiamine phosphate synthase [Nitrospira sp.]MCP9442217.1 thiamine phosphate synthase [Nitrospira sp.]
MKPTLSGLYVILDSPSVLPRVPHRPLADILNEAAEAGVRLFQYRNKGASMKEAYAEALELRRAASNCDVTFIVNDRCDLALAVDADGVHLGQDDLPYDDARRIMGPHKLVGLSTHNPDQVKEADRLKPDYIGFGPIFKPGSKRDHDPIVGVQGLMLVRSLTTLPLFAIGGITVENAEVVFKAGADGVAVISAIMNATDVKQVVGEFARLMKSSEPRW